VNGGSGEEAAAWKGDAARAVPPGDGNLAGGGLDGGTEATVQRSVLFLLLGTVPCFVIGRKTRCRYSSMNCPLNFLSVIDHAPDLMVCILGERISPVVLHACRYPLAVSRTLRMGVLVDGTSRAAFAEVF
jgi:hypothetical protein